MIDPKKYGTAAEAAEAVGVNRRTMLDAVKRRDEKLEVVETVGGTELVSIVSAKTWAKKRPKPGRKPQAESR